MANENMTMSSSGIAALRTHEHISLRYYNDQAGNCTYGIGTLAHLGPCSAEEIKRPVTLAQVNEALALRLRDAEAAVRRTVRDHSLSQAQFDSLVSFTYNLGAQGARDVLVIANRGEFSEVARHMNQYVFVHPRRNGRRLPGVRSRGLVSRRREEAAPFLDASPGRAR